MAGPGGAFLLGERGPRLKIDQQEWAEIGHQGGEQPPGEVACQGQLAAAQVHHRQKDHPSMEHDQSKTQQAGEGREGGRRGHRSKHSTVYRSQGTASGDPDQDFPIFIF